MKLWPELNLPTVYNSVCLGQLPGRSHEIQNFYTPQILFFGFESNPLYT